jgi:DNA polymerase III alpha subunit
MDKYFNYHMHSTYSNASTTDSVTNIESLIKRAIELGQDSFCITEHGNMLSKYETSFLCKKYKIKQIVGAEFYFVKDRLKETESTAINKKTKLPTKIKDRTNSHIIMIAKNRNGYEQLNTISSWANIDGFYGKPRIDLDLINKYVNENDVIITTACCSGFVAKYGIEIIQEFKRFIDAGNFYLEFQTHNTKKQIEYNKIVLEYAKEHNIPTTIACDTHIITEEDELYRNLLLKRKNIVYESEENWYLDFPSYEELCYRAEMQAIIPTNLIMESLENTNIIASQCEEYDITAYSLKIPVPLQYKNLSLEDRTKIFKDIVYMELEKYIESDEYAKNNRQLYLDTIEYELGEIIGCNTQDYFLLNYELIKRGKELGGVLTKTSRGSASCFLVNMLLGFTAMDRLQFNLPLLPERFLTKERILSAKTPPDELTSSIIEK